MNTVGMATTETTGAPVPRLTRAEAKTRTREQVLGAAEVVFGRAGYHGASLDQVAAEAGFTKGAVYSTFESKADLFLALLDRRATARRAEIDATLSAGSVEESFEALVRSFAESIAGEPGFWSALIEFMTVVGRDEELAARFTVHHDATRAAVAASIEDWAERQGVRPAVAPRRIATAVLALNNGLTLERLLSPEEVDVDLYVEAQKALLLGAENPESAGGQSQ